jgi:type I restriction enzyme S subunit
MTANGWPMVHFGNVLRSVSRPVTVEPDVMYRILGMRWYAQGLFLKEEKPGSDIRANELYCVELGDFVYNRLFAWKGSFGIVGTDTAGGCVSGEFPCFQVDTERANAKFLHLYLSQERIWQEIERISSGQTNISRLRLKEPIFLAMEIPLPPLEEQRHIVARIEELVAKIEEARGLRQKAMEESEAVIPSALHEVFEIGASDWKLILMSDAIAINDRQVDPTLPEFSGLPHISGENMESKTCRLLPYRTAEQDGVRSGNYLFSPNTILYSKIRPYLQKAVFVDFQGVCSADIYPIKVTNEELEPRFVMWGLVAGPFTEYANRISGRTRMPKLNRTQLFAFTLTYPALSEQRRIVAYLDEVQAKVDAVKRLQVETSAELEALLPSVLDRAFKGEL